MGVMDVSRYTCMVYRPTVVKQNMTPKLCVHKLLKRSEAYVWGGGNSSENLDPL